MKQLQRTLHRHGTKDGAEEEEEEANKRKNVFNKRFISNQRKWF